MVWVVRSCCFPPKNNNIIINSILQIALLDLLLSYSWTVYEELTKHTQLPSVSGDNELYRQVIWSLLNVLWGITALEGYIRKRTTRKFLLRKLRLFARQILNDCP